MRELVLWELVLWELVLWERNLLRDKGCNQTHRPMNRAPTRNGNRFFVAAGFVETGFVETDFVELVLWERNLLRDRDAGRPIAR